MSYTTKIVIKKDYQKQDQTFPIYLRITIDRKVRYYPLSKYALIGQFDSAGRVNNKHPQKNRLNTFLQTKQLEADNILLEMETNNTPITHEGFKARFLNTKLNNFFVFAEEEVAKMKEKYSKEYLNGIDTYLKKLKDFSPKLTLQEIDYSFLSDYEHYLRTKHNNRINTIHTNLKFIRKLIKIAIKRDLVIKNPFNEYQLKTEKSKREYCNKEEILLFEKLLDHDVPNYIKCTTAWFLFACYTGYRYKDIKEIERWRLYADHMTIITSKTKSEVIIYFNNRIKKITKFLDKHSFKLPSNQKANDYIKQAANLAGVKKYLSFHCARHTFGTINSMLGTDIKVNSVMLGHSNINSTQIYQHTPESVLKDALSKWDSF